MVMDMKTGSFRMGIAAIAATMALVAGGVAMAQGADYQAAKAAGQVGEKPDGYLGVVGSGTSALKAMVDDINIKRKAVYAEKAQAAHATVQEYAFTSGCLLISKTKMTAP